MPILALLEFIMDSLLPIISFFSQHPLAAFLVALVFIAPCFFPAYSGKQKSLLLPCSICWLAFGLWTFYLLGKNANIVTAVNPYVFTILLTVACLGLVIVIKGLIQKPVASCTIE